MTRATKENAAGLAAGPAAGPSASRQARIGPPALGADSMAQPLLPLSESTVRAVRTPRILDEPLRMLPTAVLELQYPNRIAEVHFILAHDVKVPLMRALYKGPHIMLS